MLIGRELDCIPANSPSTKRAARRQRIATVVIAGDSVTEIAQAEGSATITLLKKGKRPGWRN